MKAGINIDTQGIKPCRHWLALTLCWLFAILYGVWMLPEKVFIRHFCLVTGAILSLYVIYPNRKLLLKKEAAPIWIIALLILWVTFHLFFTVLVNALSLNNDKAFCAPVHDGLAGA